MNETVQSKIIVSDQAYREAYINRQKLLSIVEDISLDLSTDLNQILITTPVSMGEIFPYFLLEFRKEHAGDLQDSFMVPWSALAHYISWIDDIDDKENNFARPKEIVLATLFQYAITRISDYIGFENQPLMRTVFIEAIKGQTASFRKGSDIKSVITDLERRNSLMVIAGCGLDLKSPNKSFYKNLAQNCRLPLQLLDDFQDFWGDLETGQVSLLTYLVYEYFGDIEISELNKQDILDGIAASRCYEKALKLVEECLSKIILLDGVDVESSSARAVAFRIERVRWLKEQFGSINSIKLPGVRRQKTEELIETTYEISASS